MIPPLQKKNGSHLINLNGHIINILETPLRADFQGRCRTLPGRPPNDLGFFWSQKLGENVQI